MTTLYYYGQLHGLLVETGNKVKISASVSSPNTATAAWTSARLPINQSIRWHALAAEARAYRKEHSKSRADRRPLGYQACTDEEQMGASYPKLRMGDERVQQPQPEDLRAEQREVLTIYARAQSHTAQSQPDSGLQDSGRTVLNLDIKGRLKTLD